MAHDQIVHNVCPHLGLKDDRESHFSHPSSSHLCYSHARAVGISEEHQIQFCFSARYTECPLFTLPRAQAEGVDLSAQVEEEPVPRRSGWEILLWVLVSLGAFIAILIFLPGFLSSTNLLSPAAAPTTTPTVPAPTAVQPPVRVTGTPLVIPTGKLPVPTPRAQATVVLPTLQPNSKLFVFQTNPAQTGWIAEGEDRPHMNEHNLHAGFYQGKAYQSLVQFDLSSLPARSKILYAEIEFTGLSRDNLGSNGQWQIQFLGPDPDPDWSKQNYSAIANANAQSQLGKTLEPADLSFAQVNAFVLNDSQLSFLEQRLNAGSVTLRIKGPTGGGESIFTWDAGDPTNPKSVTRPILRVIAVPADFLVITNTPTPANVLTAAAYVDLATAIALRVGTSTPLPRGIFATATPIIVIPYGGPQNDATATALSQLATAVAKTTGTYTPIPPNVYTATPVFPTFTPLPTWTPAFIPGNQITPFVTATPTASNVDYFATPIDPALKNQILFKSNRVKDKVYNVMSPGGQWNGVLTGPTYYDAAQAREFYSPDRSKRAIVAPDSNGILQIMIEDLNFHTRTLVTHNVHGIAYDPAWSPDGRYIAYVSEETSVKELYVYDTTIDVSHRLTSGSDFTQATKHPSFSPDSSQIVFASSRSSYPRFQLWMVNVDGTGLSQIVNNQYDETDPIWVK